MGSAKELKLLTIKKVNPELYNKVMSGELSLHEAYNETKRVQLGLSEYRGQNTKKKEFTADFQRVMQLHQPTQDELITEIKKAFPFTYHEFLK